jgi:hypothetical protein
MNNIGFLMQNCLLYFRNGLLETLGDNLLYSFKYPFRSAKTSHFRGEILDTLRDAFKRKYTCSIINLGDTAKRKLCPS